MEQWLLLAQSYQHLLCRTLIRTKRRLLHVEYFQFRCRAAEMYLNYIRYGDKFEKVSKWTMSAKRRLLVSKYRSYIQISNQYEKFSIKPFFISMDISMESSLVIRIDSLSTELLQCQI